MACYPREASVFNNSALGNAHRFSSVFPGTFAELDWLGELSSDLTNLTPSPTMKPPAW